VYNYTNSAHLSAVPHTMAYHPSFTAHITNTTTSVDSGPYLSPLLLNPDVDPRGNHYGHHTMGYHHNPSDLYSDSMPRRSTSVPREYDQNNNNRSPSHLEHHMPNHRDVSSDYQYSNNSNSESTFGMYQELE